MGALGAIIVIPVTQIPQSLLGRKIRIKQIYYTMIMILTLMPQSSWVKKEEGGIQMKIVDNFHIWVSFCRAGKMAV